MTLPLTRRTVLLVTLISVIGSLLAFDQFYIMTAGQPHNETATSVFYVYLNSFPYLKLGYGAALSLILAPSSWRSPWSRCSSRAGAKHERGLRGRGARGAGNRGCCRGSGTGGRSTWSARSAWPCARSC